MKTEPEHVSDADWLVDIFMEPPPEVLNVIESWLLNYETQSVRLRILRDALRAVLGVNDGPFEDTEVIPLPPGAKAVDRSPHRRRLIARFMASKLNPVRSCEIATACGMPQGMLPQLLNFPAWFNRTPESGYELTDEGRSFVVADLAGRAN